MILSAPPATWALVTIRPSALMMKPEPSPRSRCVGLLRHAHRALALALLAEEALEEAAHVGVRHRALRRALAASAALDADIDHGRLDRGHEIGIAGIGVWWWPQAWRWPAAASRSRATRRCRRRAGRGWPTVASRGARRGPGGEMVCSVGIGYSVCACDPPPTASGVWSNAGGYTLPKWPGSFAVHDNHVQSSRLDLAIA